MKVKELLERLGKLDQNLEVLCYTEDEALTGEGNMIRALDITNVSQILLEATRHDSGEVQIKFSQKEPAKPYALFEITSDL